MADPNYRTINIDTLDSDSTINFPMDSLLPGTLPAATTSQAAASTATQVRQQLRSGDGEGALRAVLDTAPLGGDDRAKEVHLAAVIEVLQGIRQAEMAKVLQAVCGSDVDGGSERADCLMKYLYKGMAAPGPNNGTQSPKRAMSPQSTGFSQIQARNLGEGSGGQQMSVLLSWHEKLVEVTGTGAIVRVMTDRRTV